MYFWWLLGVVCFTIMACIPAWMAGRKGYNFWVVFIVSIPLWWLTFFVVLFLKDKGGPMAVA